MKVYYIVLFVLGLLIQPAYAQNQEAKIQALFILKFIDNISWPQDRKDVIIGVLGKSDVLTELEVRLQAKNPNGIVIKKISSAEAANCDVIFLSKQESASLSAVNAALKGKSILIISETDLSRKGSGISFIQEDGKLNFIVNKSVIESNGLKVSNTLLTLGKQA